MKKKPLNLQQSQMRNIALITFWSQFAAAAQYAILVLFLARPLMQQGLGYSQAEAYTFFGVCQAVVYLTVLLGGYMADNVLGLRRSVLLGSMLLACAYLLVTLSGYLIPVFGRGLFIAAYALIPAANSLLMGTTSSLVTRIYRAEVTQAKIAMTWYYLAINVGALLAFLVAPALLDSVYGPMSVFAVAFVGKALSAINFARKYDIYDSLCNRKDTQAFSGQDKLKLLLYLLIAYLGTVAAYQWTRPATLLITVGCILGLCWFLQKTWQLSGVTRIKQGLAVVLVLEAVIFYIIYNQMHTTLIFFAKSNSDNLLWGITLSPAHYQLFNPLVILLCGMQLPKFYRRFPQFTIPYQFAFGTIVAGLGLLVMAYGASVASNGLVGSHYLIMTYILISFAELCVSSMGMSMIGLYCDAKNLAFAMGVWNLAVSLSNTLSAGLAQWVALPINLDSPLQSLPVYEQFYHYVGWSALGLGLAMVALAFGLHRYFGKRGILLH